MTITRTPIPTREDWLAMRATNIGASEIAALFGASQFKTHLQLWAEKSGQISDQGPSSQIMERGLILEPAVAEAVRVLRPDWRLEKNQDYYASAEWRIGATPDYLAYDPVRESVGVVQTKAIAMPEYQEKWQDGPPTGYILQTAQELLLYGEHFRKAIGDAPIGWGAIGVLAISSYGYEKQVWEFERHSGAEARIIRAASAFWAGVESGNPPPADFTRDGDTIRSLYPTDDGSMVDLSGDNRLAFLLAERARLQEDLATAKPAEKELDAVNTEIRAKLGAASVAICDGWEVSHKLQHRKATEASSFRVLRTKRIKQGRMAA